jgi:hypothetical protein
MLKGMPEEAVARGCVALEMIREDKQAQPEVGALRL